MRTIYGYLNHFADKDNYKDKSKEFNEGYDQACKDIFNKLFDNKIEMRINIMNIKIIEEEDTNGRRDRTKKK